MSARPDPRSARIVAWLERPRAHLWLAAAALLMLSPALGTGLLLDDHVLSVLARDRSGVDGLHSDRWFLFSFTTGRPADNLALMDEGVLLPWWSDPRHRNAFLRPLSSLSHVVDFALWPDAAWLMHAHSLLWFLSLLLVVAHVYRTLEHGPRAVAVLAFALFALDDAHAMTATWISNRNALLAAAFALPAVSAHHRYVAHGFRAGAYLGPACFALGLCAGETALAVLGYLFAYALTLDTAPWSRRALRLVPYLLVVLAWRTLFVALDLGSEGSGAYHDPAREPLGYALALLSHLPILIAAQVSLPLADSWFWGPPEAQSVLLALALLCVLAFAAVARVFLRRDREANFWLLGMLLSACAVAASVPGERLLLVPGVGGAVVIAKLLWATGSASAESAALLPRLVFGVLFVLHGVMGPLALPVRVLGFGQLGSAIARVDRDLPGTPAIAEQTAVVLNAPFDLLLSYLQVARAARGVPRPRHLYWLATASSPVHLEGRAAHTLRVRPERGFVLTSPERHYRADPSTLVPGSHVTLSELSANVLTVTADQRPALVDFRFREPLRSPRYRFLRYEQGRLLPWAIPPPGAGLVLPREDFFATMLGEALRPLHATP